MSSGESVLDIGSQKQLFVDDYIIRDLTRVAQTLNEPKKHSDNPLMTAEYPWEEFFACQANTVLYDEDEKLFRMWYNLGPNMYATSKDGLVWKRPNLGLVECNGSKENNVIDLPLDAGPNAFGLVYSPEDPDPSRRYKMLIWDLKKDNGNYSGGYYAFISPDGYSWAINPKEPVLPYDGDIGDVNPIMYDEITENYVSFVKVHKKVGKWNRRSIGLSTSKDFVSWSKPVLVLAPDEADDMMAAARIAKAKGSLEFDHPDDYRTEFYGMPGFPYEGMYLGFPWVFDASMELSRIGRHNQDGPFEVQLTSSRDLKHWKRAGDRRSFIPFGETGEWDSGMITTVNRPIIVGDEIWIYYGGYNLTHESRFYWEENKEELPAMVASGERRKPTGIGLATLRLDGWVSVDAGDEEGMVTTRPFVCRGREIVINASAEKGYIAAEVLDEGGEPVPGLTRNDCTGFNGNAVEHPVRWKGGTVLKKGVSCRLRFYMKRAKLYSFRIA